LPPATRRERIPTRVAGLCRIGANMRTSAAGVGAPRQMKAANEQGYHDAP